MTTARRDQFLSSIDDKRARDAFVAAHIETGIRFQVRLNRLARKLTQKELGTAAAMKQSAISRIEAGEAGLPNLDTLLRLASAFDIGLVVQFVSFSELLDRAEGLASASLEVDSFESDSALHRSPQEATAVSDLFVLDTDGMTGVSDVSQTDYNPVEATA